ncbi:MAG: UvrD-helicase domain-containing protein [Methylophilaceae bacterium]
MTTPDLLQQDALNRERALALSSFIVEAPAGAGKTELLTQRYLGLLAVVNEPEEIVAITFTNKAAAEMRGRVLGSLQDAADDAPITQPHKRRTRELALAALSRSALHHWDLLAQPGRLRINTIDSLSSLLARQMPLMSRFGSQPALIDDATALYQEAASRAVAMLELENTAGDAPIKAALQYFDNDAGRLTQQLATMLAKRDQWLQHTGQSVQDEALAALRYLVELDIRSAAVLIPESVQTKLMPIARYAASHLPCEHCVSLLLDWETPIPATLEALPMWLAVCDLLLTKDGDFRKEKGINIKNGFPATEEGKTYKQALLDVMTMIPDATALATVRKLPDLRNSEEDGRMVGALASLLKLAAAHLITVFQESGEVDFVEVSQRALQALEDDTGPTDLALRLDYRIQHLLVDEFQDTSPTQVVLLQKLTAGWQAQDGRTLFCVGDPMQSIYRFRKADVGLFLQVAAFGIGHLSLEKLYLTRNNRSCPAVVDWINHTFANVFPLKDSVTRGAISYREFAATRSSMPGEGIEIHPIIADRDADTENIALSEAQRIADIIEREHAEDASRTIAVLVRARSHLHALVAEIRRNRPSLKFQAVEVEALADRQGVQDILALTRALLHRADRVNWLAILRAPWCGLTLADMHLLAADDHRSTIWQLMHQAERIAMLSQDGQARLLHIRDIIAEAFAYQGRQSIRRWVESVWLKLGGPACLWDEGDVRDIQAFLDLIEKLDSAGRFDITALEAEMAHLYAAPDVHADGCLQFMTIHKSKGLEFDTVILPGLHRQPNNRDAPLLLWEEVAIDDAEPQLVAAAWRPKHLRDENLSAYDYLQRLEQERSHNESARVLYVAATRAIRCLHLVAAVKPDSKNEIKPLANTFLELLWPNVGGEFLRQAEQTQSIEHHDSVLPEHIEATDSMGFIPQLIRLQSPRVADVLMHDAALKVRVNYQTNTPDDESALQFGKRLDASIGSLAHRYVELIAKEGVDAWPVHRIESLSAVMQYWLTAQGHSHEASAQGATLTIQALITTLNSQHGRWILQKRDDNAAELAISSFGSNLDKQLLATHIIDRTFVEDGQRWIIDYKSAAMAGMNTENRDSLRLDLLAEQYRPQLERYAALFKNEGLPVRKAIFFLSLGRLVELD